MANSFSMRSAEYWIEKLGLIAHPEGGFYRETYRSAENIPKEGLPPRFSGQRNFSTSIYFLLRSQDRSLFHRIKSDELWHFHAGSSLTIYILHDGQLELKKLGPDPDKGEALQIVVPANCWFGGHINSQDGYVLAGCTVAPGFDFNDFELASRHELLEAFPKFEKEIIRLTK